jgi:hypothetical protein
MRSPKVGDLIRINYSMSLLPEFLISDRIHYENVIFKITVIAEPGKFDGMQKTYVVIPTGTFSSNVCKDMWLYINEFTIITDYKELIKIIDEIQEAF